MTGFDTRRHKLLCLVALHDEIASAISNDAGAAFFRGFIVEERATGKIYMNQRFRYSDGDSWIRVQVAAEEQNLSRAERVALLREGIEGALRTAFAALSGIPAPKDAVMSFFPPDPDGDPKNTLDWLIRQDLVEIESIEPLQETPDAL